MHGDGEAACACLRQRAPRMKMRCLGIRLRTAQQGLPNQRSRVARMYLRTYSCLAPPRGGRNAGPRASKPRPRGVREKWYANVDGSPAHYETAANSLPRLAPPAVLELPMQRQQRRKENACEGSAEMKDSISRHSMSLRLSYVFLVMAREFHTAMKKKARLRLSRR